jgi:uncharacterized protein (TIGR03435 family)
MIAPLSGTRASVTAVALVVSAVLLPAQAVSGPTAFEVASIKRNVSGGPSRGRTEPGGRFTATNAPVLQFIRLAYGNLSPDRILNAPEWVTSERYDLVAKAPEGVQAPRVMGSLMQSLLRERFAFDAHMETREMPIFELVLARRDGRLGPKLQRASCDCTGSKAEPGCKQGPEAAAFPEFDGLTCIQMGLPGRRLMRGFPLRDFEDQVNGRVVVDKTGLTGTWNVELEFTPEDPSGPRDPSASDLTPRETAPSFFTAVEEQLGLRFRPARGLVDVVVVDRIERPTPD